MSRVSMPGPGYRRPDRVDESGLVVSVTGTAGGAADTVSDKVTIG